MTHIIHKPYWNFEREEQWLNDMAAKGLALTDYSWCRYVFEDAQPGEYIYRIELLAHPASHPESQKYITFVEETGAEHVASYMRWVYFRKKAVDGSFDLYSDIESRLRHYKKVNAFWAAFFGIELSAALLNFIVYLIDRTVNTQISLILGFILLGLGGLYFIIGIPIRKKIQNLKREKRVRER